MIKSPHLFGFGLGLIVCGAALFFTSLLAEPFSDEGFFRFLGGMIMGGVGVVLCVASAETGRRKVKAILPMPDDEAQHIMRETAAEAALMRFSPKEREIIREYHAAKRSWENVGMTNIANRSDAERALIDIESHKALDRYMRAGAAYSAMIQQRDQLGSSQADWRN